VDSIQLLDQLVGLAREAGIDVRVLSGSSGADLPPQSAVCRVRGRVWVVLSDADLASQRIRVLTEALREHGGRAIEGRYLPPAIRELLEGD
jgi:hypothetical protein